MEVLQTSLRNFKHNHLEAVFTLMTHSSDTDLTEADLSAVICLHCQNIHLFFLTISLHTDVPPESSSTQSLHSFAVSGTHLEPLSQQQNTYCHTAVVKQGSAQQKGAVTALREPQDTWEQAAGTHQMPVRKTN